MALKPQPGGTKRGSAKEFDRSIASVVVIGNGIAGVTAADFTRRGHPDCEIHLVGAESHVLYNRMGISRLVYGRSAMQGLFLLAEQWYDEHNITAWLNTVATRIDLGAQRVFLGTGEVLFLRPSWSWPWEAVAPSRRLRGSECPGSFVMREAGDAAAIRAYVQRNGCRQAVVSGGGLIGPGSGLLAVRARPGSHRPRTRAPALVPPDRPAVQRVGPQVLLGDRHAGHLYRRRNRCAAGQ